MKKSELRQIIKEEISKVLNKGALNEAGHAYSVRHKVGDVLDLPVVGKCKVKEINVKPKKSYSNPWTAWGKDFNTFEPFKVFLKTTHSPQSVGNNAMILVDNNYGDEIIAYQYESGGKVYTQYAIMN